MPLPLSALPADVRAEIERLAEGDRPPPRWLRLGHVEIPSRAWYEWHLRHAGERAERRAERGRVRALGLRLAIAERDGWTCGICGQPIAGERDLHVDHIVPLCRGGRSDDSNLQATHARCNLRKGGR